MITEKQKEQQKEYREKNKDKYKEQQKEWREKNKDKIKEQQKEHNLKKNYGLTMEDFKNKLKEQNNICPICNLNLDIKATNGMSVVVDHCHHTGNNRALLHSICNIRIGMFNDDILLMKNAIVYLEKNKQ